MKLENQSYKLPDLYQ